MPSRYICSVIEEARTCIKTLNFSYLSSLLEEIQILANRMEAALWDQKSHKVIHQELKEAKAELKKIQEKIKEQD
jgi:hypothetical protein